MGQTKILMIEDDADIREGVRALLEGEEYLVCEADRGQRGLELLDETVDLVILDVMMPGMSGFETCRLLREKSMAPVLFLTAKTGESDRLVGLMVGGDDYLSKPFSYAELLGRVKALLRRYLVYSGKQGGSGDGKQGWIRIGNIRINQDDNEVTVDDRKKELTELEYKILLLMMRNPRKTFSAQALYETVWEEPYLYSSNSTVMVHIRRLRTKIEAVPEAPVHIRTVWGKGYRFE